MPPNNYTATLEPIQETVETPLTTELRGPHYELGYFEGPKRAEAWINAMAKDGYKVEKMTADDGGLWVLMFKHCYALR